MLEIKHDQLENRPLLVLHGRFDGMGASIFDTTVAQQPDLLTGPVLLDMASVNYLSSAGMRSLIMLGKAATRARQRLWLLGMQPEVRQVLEMAGLLAQSEILANRHEASARLRSDAASRAQETKITLGGRQLALQPVPDSSSILEPLPTTGKLTCLALDEVGIAVGHAGLGNTHDQAAGAVDAFLSTGHMICVRPTAMENALPDFIVSNQPEDVPVYVAEGTRLTGMPAAVVRSDERCCALNDITSAFPELLQMATGQPSANMAWIIAAMDVDNGDPQGWVGVGIQTAAGRSLFECVLVDAFELSESPDDLPLFLRTVVRTETLAGAFAPTGDRRVGQYKAWLFAPEWKSASTRRCRVVFPDLPQEPPEEWDWIARRIYADAGNVHLRQLEGGFSAATFHVESIDREGRRMLPTVLKIAGTAFSERETRAYDLYVSKYILNNSAVRIGQCARNGWVGLRYNFLGITGPESQLSWIGEHLVKRPIEQTCLLFRELFQKILSPWYGQTRPCTLQPYREHDPRKLFPTLTAEVMPALGISIDQPYIACPPLGRKLPNPYFLLENVYPERAAAQWPGLSSIVHGDLNLNNVLLDEKENMYVIDFSETHIGDVCGDFARLEPLMLVQMAQLRDDNDLAALLRYIHSIVRPGLFFDPPYTYAGDDPFMPKAHALVRLLRAELQRVAGTTPYTVPYLLALLRWTLPIVVFRQLPLLYKQASCYVSALLTEALLEADPESEKL